MIGDALLLAEAQQASALEAQASAERLQQDVERLKAEAAQAECPKDTCMSNFTSQSQNFRSLERNGGDGVAIRVWVCMYEGGSDKSLLHRQRVQVPDLLGRLSELEASSCSFGALSI